MAAAHQNVGVPQKIEKHLRYVAGRSQFPGDLVPIQGDVDYPLFDCTTSQELEFIADHVRVKGYLDQRKPHGEAILTVAGWDYIQPTLRPGGEPDRCFIAMAFQAGLAEAYTIGIKPAVEECGFRAIRIDELSTNEGITDRILAEIRRAHFVVADFTLQRGGVYFEAGFARGLGREVIWCCRADDLCNVHFDVKHFGHVVWEGPDELREKLTASIRANIIPQG